MPGELEGRVARFIGIVGVGALRLTQCAERCFCRKCAELTFLKGIDVVHVRACTLTLNDHADVLQLTLSGDRHRSLDIRTACILSVMYVLFTVTTQKTPSSPKAPSASFLPDVSLSVIDQMRSETYIRSVKTRLCLQLPPGAQPLADEDPSLQRVLLRPSTLPSQNEQLLLGKTWHV